MFLIAFTTLAVTAVIAKILDYLTRTPRGGTVRVNLLEAGRANL